EDDPDDRFLTQSTLTELGYDIQIKFAKHGKELFSLLDQFGNPYLILLDFNSYPDNALGILRILKKDQKIKHIPVIVLSDSLSSKDARDCYSNGANSY